MEESELREYDFSNVYRDGEIEYLDQKRKLIAETPECLRDN